MKGIYYFMLVFLALIIEGWPMNGYSEQDSWSQFKKSIGATDDIAERYAEADIALPASEEEYCGLAGNAIVMITAVSEHPKELPLAKAYFRTADGKEIILKKLVLSSDVNEFSGDKISKTRFADGKKDCFVNLSFWLLPVQSLLDDKGVIVIDFKENRKSFSVCRGPWEIEKRNQEYTRRQSQGSIKIAERLNNDILAKFLEREFVTPRLSKDKGE